MSEDSDVPTPASRQHLMVGMTDIGVVRILLADRLCPGAIQG